MIENVGKGNLILSGMTTETLSNSLNEFIKTNATCTSKTVLDLVPDISKVLLLDPAAEKELSPDDGKVHGFEYLLFGGILGDDPPRDRTKELRVKGFATRHLGKHQMTTDTAVIVSKMVLVEGIPLNKIPFVDRPDIKIFKNESVEMPFRYVVENGEPKVPKGFIDLLRKTNDDSLL
ncbi:hypothetical protein HDU76_010263 [Blyttiomyces sp. JEL0837]|nr:hypothetical protein HDU76_010263 [Blyttiomyces sp. JEL0837]